MSGSSVDDIVTGYIEEVETYIPPLTEGLASLKENPRQAGVLEETHRLVHTIKGASSMVGIHGLSHIAYQMEEALEDVIAGKLAFDQAAFEAMSRTIACFKRYCSDYLAEGVPARRMLKETLLDYQKLRGAAGGLTAEQEALLNAVSEREIRPRAPEESAPRPDDETSEDAREPAAEGAGEIAPAPDHAFGRAAEDGEPIPELMESFYQEAEEHLDELGRTLTVLEARITEATPVSAAHRELLRRFRRSVHTLKGASAIIGMEEISAWSHRMEDMLDWLYEAARRISPETVATLTEASDVLTGLVWHPEKDRRDKMKELEGRFDALMSGPAGRQADATPQTDAEFGAISLQEDAARAPDVEGASAGEAAASEEKAEDALAEGAPYVAGKTLRVGMDRIDELVNLGSELIIAASAIDQRMDRFTEALDEIEASRARLREIAREMEIGYEVKSLAGLPSRREELPVRAAAAAGRGGFDDFDSLELDRYSELNLIIRGLNEAVIDVGAISANLANLYSDIEGHLNRQRVILSELQEKTMRVRMTPMSVIVNKLRRTVRTVAARLNKKVRLLVKGADIELDRMVWEKITDPLMHMLRNAADHGIEPPALRQALGKPETGTIKLSASREGNQVVIRIEDDGAGLNFEAIRKAVRMEGLYGPVDELSDEELAAFIFSPGFSTRGKVSEVSGRGVGMDVVRENIRELKGAVRAASRKGKGTRFTIRIPLTLAAIRALLFTAGGQTFAAALNEISQIIRIGPEDVRREVSDAVRIGDEVLPLYYLTRALHFTDRAEDRAEAPQNPIVLVLAAGGRKGAMVIDSLIGQREIVIKSLGSHLLYVRGVSGATILGDGGVVPILNVEELLGAGSEEIETDAADIAPRVQRPLDVMIVDDSVSVRQVTARLIQKQGWRARTAKDGVDALEQLREGRPDMIILDIEMPRMNGYEFLSALRAEPAYRDIPVAVLTSRTAEKHRKKALSLGAGGFVVKPYDDAEFIDLIIKMTG